MILILVVRLFIKYWYIYCNRLVCLCRTVVCHQYCKRFNFCFDFVECKQITSCLFCGFMLCSFHSLSLNTMSFGYASLQFTETSCWVTMQVSYMILAQVSPVTHSVGNCVKRVIVIVTSVLFFRTPVSTVNALGKPAILSKFQLYTYCIYSYNGRTFTRRMERLTGCCIWSIWQELAWLWLEYLLILKWKPRKETRKRSRLYVCHGHLWLL